MSAISRRICIALVATLCVACDEDAPARPSYPPDTPPKPTARPRSSTTATARATANPRMPSATASAKKRDLDQKCTPAAPDALPLEITQFTLTSKLDKRKPTDELTIIQPETKIYAYLVVKNLGTTERCLLVTFRVNGKKRASLTLDIGTSPTWRTWAQITPAKGDAPGDVEIEITDDHGKQRYQQKVLIEPSAR